MAGKGSVRRPQAVTAAELARRWALAFGTTAPKPTPPRQPQDRYGKPAQPVRRTT